MPVDFRKHSKRQQDLSKEISLLVKTLKKGRQKRFGFWEKAVGEKISEIAVPYRVKNDVLMVRVSDSVWRFELTKRKEELLNKINEDPKNKMKDIVFK